MADAIVELCRRCEAFSLPVWCFDGAGVATMGPKDPHPWAIVALPAGQHAAICAAKARDARTIVRSDLCPGVACLGIPLVVSSEVRRVAVVAVATRCYLGSSPFVELCAAASVDPAMVRGRLEGALARDSMDQERLVKVVTMWGEDLARAEEASRAIEGFTTQLGNAFDTIEFLYSVGRSMRDPTRPEPFLQFVCERLRSTMDYDWVSLGFARDADEVASVPVEIVDRVFSSGQLPLPVGASLKRVHDLVGECSRTNQSQLLDRDQVLSSARSPQVVGHPLSREGMGLGAVLAGGRRGEDSAVSSYELQLMEAAASFVGAYIETAALYAEQKRLFLGTVHAVTAAIDAKDAYTRGHSERVAHLSWLIARLSGMPSDQAERVRIAGLVHDVGKIGVPEAVLTKQGRLTEEEFSHIKRHPEIGYRILRDIPQLGDVLPGVLHHHERWDGRGYPTNLSGQEIPQMARIIAIADTFDAMSSTRSYRPAMPRERVLAELARSAGTQLDPEYVPIALEMDLSFYDELVSRHKADAPSWPGESGESRAA